MSYAANTSVSPERSQAEIKSNGGVDRTMQGGKE